MSAPETISEPLKPASRKWKSLGVRIVTGLLMALIAIIPFYLGGVFWPCLVALIAARAIWEWVRMSEEKATPLAYIIPILGALAALTAVYLGDYKVATILMFIVAAIAGLERIKRRGAIWASLGFIYIIIPAILLIVLRGHEVGFEAPGFVNLIYVIWVVIAADSGAYIGGSMIGGPKMAPKLSPNKTWALSLIHI